LLISGLRSRMRKVLDKQKKVDRISRDEDKLYND